jgi:hypothetical protein
MKESNGDTLSQGGGHPRGHFKIEDKWTKDKTKCYYEGKAM